MLGVKDLYCERDDRVLFRNLGFETAAGDIWQIQGSNGSGKTTLLRILCGLNDEYQGEIHWNGQALHKVRADFHRQLFYLGHAPAINKTLTPRENLRWFCASRGLDKTDEIKQALNSFKLYGYDDLPCYQLSAGQQRRVSLARLKLSAAPLWIVDEPFTALDKAGVAELEAFLESHADNGGTVILTTHHSLNMKSPVKTIDLDALATQVAA
ncbi:MAG: heme ABC transporter ATP-binding protein CcmA [Gammaproteobacteria bacterium]|nr:heme ABC transporter ATP-binding protein CcmA [Gammaproteobacteria bacterium]MAY02774.1 heme ABC transporter ATP-binding protein CcmA [Gammaproteobacteria bacterium]|tara:strand:- start:778 stop:1410 length:633 start_codon:yes stop_codon:yes gene_type:complete